jgi:hypothetical protein
MHTPDLLIRTKSLINLTLVLYLNYSEGIICYYATVLSSTTTSNEFTGLNYIYLERHIVGCYCISLSSIYIMNNSDMTTAPSCEMVEETLE